MLKFHKQLGFGDRDPKSLWGGAWAEDAPQLGGKRSGGGAQWTKRVPGTSRQSLTLWGSHGGGGVFWGPSEASISGEAGKAWVGVGVQTRRETLVSGSSALGRAGGRPPSPRQRKQRGFFPAGPSEGWVWRSSVGVPTEEIQKPLGLTILGRFPSVWVDGGRPQQPRLEVAQEQRGPQ